MRFPLNKKKLIRGAKGHVDSGLGIGADYVADNDELFAPLDGNVQIYTGDEGGKWLRLYGIDGLQYEFAHLSKYHVKNGDRVKEGQLVAVTGNTGRITTGPHLHIQIFKGGKRIDPESINWNEPMVDIALEQFKACFITWVTRWPTDEEVKTWRTSGKEPWGYMQEMFINPRIQELENKPAQVVEKVVTKIIEKPVEVIKEVIVPCPEKEQVGMIKSFVQLISKWFKESK